MAIYTPRGLAIKLPVPYTFALMKRLHPTVDAFTVLKTTEGLQCLPAVLTFATGIACFSLKADSYHIAIYTFFVSLIGTVVTLFGVFIVPGLPLAGTLYSYVSGFGILFIILVVYGLVAVGWQGVLAFFVSRLLAGIVSFVLDFWNSERIYGRIGKPFISQNLTS